MSDNRNVSSALSADGRGTVIDTQRVFDSCRDRDCFENSRVYLTSFGEEIISGTTNIRARSAKVLWAHVSVTAVPFNCGFYQVTIRYYILTELEACLGMGRSQCFKGISVLEKNVILYGGEGSVSTFSSDPRNGNCAHGNMDNVGSNDPVAIAETVEPIVLGVKVVGCGHHKGSCETADIPDGIREAVDGELVINSDGPRLYISYGVFSVIRIVRPVQLLVQATDYSVPDKECTVATNEEDPCALFSALAFPSDRFRASGCCNNNSNNDSSSRGNRNCGCSERKG